MNNPETIFYIIIGILVLNFIKDKVLDSLNASRFESDLPTELKNIYDESEYQKSQNYKSTNFKFSLFSSVFSFVVTLSFLIFGGFKFVDDLARSFSNSSIIIALLFFGLISIGNTIISIPFSYYKTFVIESKFGFNKSTKTIFFTDLLKGIMMSIIIGGPILALIVWFYNLTSTYFWLYAWGLITIFSLLMNMFYARLIVPIFNKQIPTEEGSLKNKIASYAESVGFSLKKFSSLTDLNEAQRPMLTSLVLEKKKRVTLYDTLINDLTEEEIVAVLAHEVGHYKKKHIIFNLIASILLTGITLYLLSIFIANPNLSLAIGVSTPSFHASLIAFSLLYAPISEITGLVMNYISRAFEHQADAFCKKNL